MQLVSDPESTHSLKYENLFGFLSSLFTISLLYWTLPFKCLSQKWKQILRMAFFYPFALKNYVFFSNRLKDYLPFSLFGKLDIYTWLEPGRIKGKDSAH